MHCAPACGQSAPQPLRVAGPLQGMPCSSRHKLDRGYRYLDAVNSLMVLTLRVRGQSSHTVEIPAPIVAPTGGRVASPWSTLMTSSTTAAIWCDFRRAAGHIVIYWNDLIQRLRAPGKTWGCAIRLRASHGAELRTNVFRIVSRDAVIRCFEDVFRLVEICQTRDAAFAGTRAKGDQDLATYGAAGGQFPRSRCCGCRH